MEPVGGRRRAPGPLAGVEIRDRPQRCLVPLGLLVPLEGHFVGGRDRQAVGRGLHRVPGVDLPCAVGGIRPHLRPQVVGLLPQRVRDDGGREHRVHRAHQQGDAADVRGGQQGAGAIAHAHRVQRDGHSRDHVYPWRHQGDIAARVGVLPDGLVRVDRADAYHVAGQGSRVLGGVAELALVAHRRDDHRAMFGGVGERGVQGGVQRAGQVAVIGADVDDPRPLVHRVTDARSYVTPVEDIHVVGGVPANDLDGEDGGLPGQADDAKAVVGLGGDDARHHRPAARLADVLDIAVVVVEVPGRLAVDVAGQVRVVEVDPGIEDRDDAQRIRRAGGVVPGGRRGDGPQVPLVGEELVVGRRDGRGAGRRPRRRSAQGTAGGVGGGLGIVRLQAGDARQLGDAREGALVGRAVHDQRLRAVHRRVDAQPGLRQARAGQAQVDILGEVDDITRRGHRGQRRRSFRCPHQPTRHRQGKQGDYQGGTRH